MKLLKEIRLIKVEVGSNANKWWTGQLFDNGTVKATWGRVGYAGDSGEWQGGETYLNKKLKEKIKKGYTEQKTIGEISQTKIASGKELKTIARSELVKQADPLLSNLIDRLVDANIHKIVSNTDISYNSNTGLFTTPLGIVTMEGLTEARDILADISVLVRKNTYDTRLNNLVGDYLRIIPQHVGMKLNIKSLFPDEKSIQKQADLLDSLESSYQSIQTSKQPVDKKENVFDVKINVLKDYDIQNKLMRWFEKSKKSMHHYDRIKVHQIFEISIGEMERGFNTKLGNITEVWHGTSQANCLSILKHGLKISPPSTAQIAGKLFGNGIYGATSSSKSLGYTFGRWGQGGVGDSGWLFVCDFAMGNIYETKSFGASKPAKYDSIWAKSSYGGLKNDELIVYKNNQVNIKYLLECK